MKILVQRVSQASVEVEGKRVASIRRGVLALVGVTHRDTEKEASYLAQKLASLRIFEDEEQTMNRSLLDIQGEVLIVSQFTLYGDCSQGRRPSFLQAARPEQAELLYLTFIQEVKNSALSVQTGVFGASMKVSLVNEGPVTLMMEK